MALHYAPAYRIQHNDTYCVSPTQTPICTRMPRHRFTGVDVSTSNVRTAPSLLYIALAAEDILVELYIELRRPLSRLSSLYWRRLNARKPNTSHNQYFTYLSKFVPDMLTKTSFRIQSQDQGHCTLMNFSRTSSISFIIHCTILCKIYITSTTLPACLV